MKEEIFPTFPDSSIEKEQTKEEITAILERALEENRYVDLDICDSAGKVNPTPDLIVEEIEGDYLTMTYLVNDGGLGESIPLNVKRIKKAVLKERIDKETVGDDDK